MLFGARASGMPGVENKWDKVLADAKKEGKVAVAGPPGTAYRDVMRGFEKKYPEISLDFKVLLRRVLPRDFQKSARPDNIFGISTLPAPLVLISRPKRRESWTRSDRYFILPEVLDEKAWLGGFDKAFLDSEKQYIFAFQAQITPQVLVNREFFLRKN